MINDTLTVEIDAKTTEEFDELMDDLDCSDGPSKIEQIRLDAEAHGEVHATISDHEKELEVRQGTTTFAKKEGYLRVRDGDKTIVVPEDSIVSWYTPTEAWH